MQIGADDSGTHAIPDQTYRSVVSDLVSLIEHVQISIRQVEQAIAGEVSLVEARHDVQGDVVVLDDVTPGYVMADAALHACSARLGAALHVLTN